MRDKTEQLAKHMQKLRKQAVLPKQKKDHLEFVKKINQGRIKKAYKDGNRFVLEAVRVTPKGTRPVKLVNPNEFEVYKDLCTLSNEELI